MYKVKMTPESKVYYLEMYKHEKGSDLALAKVAGVDSKSF